jgi:ABC-type methionine transport system ATPase subunit
MADAIDEGAQIRPIAANSSEHAKIAAICMHLEQVTAPLIAEAADQVELTSQMITAACTFAGTLFGKLIIAGVATDQDKRKATEVAAKNFRSGIEIGKKAAMRVACEEFGSAMQ